MTAQRPASRDNERDGSIHRQLKAKSRMFVTTAVPLNWCEDSRLELLCVLHFHRACVTACVAKLHNRSLFVSHQPVRIDTVNQLREDARVERHVSVAHAIHGYACWGLIREISGVPDQEVRSWIGHAADVLKHRRHEDCSTHRCATVAVWKSSDDMGASVLRVGSSDARVVHGLKIESVLLGHRGLRQ